jgi:AraC-like DNA-binding protein
MYYENKIYDIHIRNSFGDEGHLQCPLHLHYHVEAVYMKEGNSVAVVDGREYDLPPDSLLVVFPNRPHTYISSEIERYTIAIISPNIMPEVVRLFDSYEPKYPVIERVSEYPDLYNTIELLSTLPTHGNDGRRNDVVRRGYASALMGLIFKYLPTEKTNVECSRAMRSVIDYCVRNYNKEISLGVLSEELHMSKYYISHLFGKEFNMKFNDYVNSLRIMAASRLLCDTDKNITKISEEVGFATARTFNRAFNKLHNVSPTEYRNFARKRNN